MYGSRDSSQKLSAFKIQSWMESRTLKELEHNRLAPTAQAKGRPETGEGGVTDKSTLRERLVFKPGFPVQVFAIPVLLVQPLLVLVQPCFGRGGLVQPRATLNPSLPPPKRTGFGSRSTSHCCTKNTFPGFRLGQGSPFLTTGTTASFCLPC